MITPRDLEWTAGFLEGEGSFTWHRSYARIQAGQVQIQPLDRLNQLYGGTLRSYQPKNPNAQYVTYWCLAGIDAVGLMMTMFPLMSPKRKDQIRAVLSQWKSRPQYKRYWTHCPNGHPYSGYNLIQEKKHRRCRACRDASMARFIEKKNA